MWRRLGALGIDALIIMTPVVAGWLATERLVLGSQSPVFEPGWPGLWLLAAIWVVYGTVLEVVWAGATVGKRLTGVRVVPRDGKGAVGWRASFLRNLLRIPEQFMCGLVGLGTALFSVGHRRLGDMAGRTLVVHRDAVGHIGRTPWTG